MPSLRLLRQTSPSDVLAVAISGLEVLKETSNAVVAIPLMGDIIGVALGIAKTVERIRGDRERFVRLARSASELLRHIEDTIAADPQAVDDKLRLHLHGLYSLLVRIQSDVEVQLRRTPLARFLLQGSITEMLEDRTHQIETAWRAFDTACLIDLRMKAATQAIYDDRTQLRLFRRNEIRCFKVRGTYRIDGRDVGEEWEGRWEGRAVVVRTIRTPANSQLYQESLVRYYPNIYHPYIAQILGYSHPSLQERFYVMDTGVIPLISQFRGKDIQSRLFQWLQHVVDYQNTFRYLEGLGFPVSECHSHDRCLPSAMLNEEGRLIVDAEDFRDSNLGCFQSCLRTLYDQENGALSPGRDYANDDDVVPYASALLSQLGSRIRVDESVVETFLRSDLAKIWASHQFQDHGNAQWGDYGYIKREGVHEVFVRLGNIYDLVTPTGKLSTFLLTRYEGDDWQPATDYPWSEGNVSHEFRLFPGCHERVEDIAVVRTLPDDCEYHDFFWNHAEQVSSDNGLQVHDIVLFEEIFHYACAVVDNGEADATATLANSSCTAEQVPASVFFHQLPLLASGEAPNPWGYWSLDPEPTLGPWPALEFPGIDLTCRVQSNYARVSTFESEILVYLNQLRRGRNHNLDMPS